MKKHANIHIWNCKDALSSINSGNKSFDLIPQTFKQIHFISEKLSFCFLDLGAFPSDASLACLSYW
jgi:hypothetical protein